MTIFDLLFLASVVASIATLVAVAVLAMRGRRAEALRILRVYGMCALAYLAVALAVDFFKPQRVIAVGDPWCFDDWCLQVQKVDAVPSGSTVTYDVQLRFFSTARRVSQRAPQGASVYLIDAQGVLYSSKPDSSATPLTVELTPEQSVNTSRVFEVPAGLSRPGLVHVHGAPYCGLGSLLIIGEGGCLFNRPTMIRFTGVE